MRLAQSLSAHRTHRSPVLHLWRAANRSCWRYGHTGRVDVGARNHTIGGPMSKMRLVQVTRPNGPLEIVEREIPEPKAGQVRIKVEACGICHSDSMTKEGLWPGIQYP